MKTGKYKYWLILLIISTGIGGLVGLVASLLGYGVLKVTTQGLTNSQFYLVMVLFVSGGALVGFFMAWQNRP